MAKAKSHLSTPAAGKAAQRNEATPNPRVPRPEALAGYQAAVEPLASKARMWVRAMPDEVRQSIQSLKSSERSFHGAKFSLAYFRSSRLTSPCADRFGYMSPPQIRNATKLPFDASTRALLEALGGLMGDAGREAAPDSVIPAGFTYVGQFVDHDITMDVSSNLDVATDANTVHNMRTPSLELDNVYMRGPALDPFLYVFPTVGNPTAIKFQLGTNRNTGPGGPGGTAGQPGMKVQVDFDVPRMPATANTAIVGDPRNDENLIVVQLHQTMLRFHNAVVERLLAAGFVQVFEFNRNPRLPVFSNWVVDFNAFFDTSVAVPVNNEARKIDSVLAAGLESLPGFAGILQILAVRNLRRGLALGLPSGQGMARHLRVHTMNETRSRRACLRLRSRSSSGRTSCS